MNTDTNRCDVNVGQHTITAEVDGQPVLFRTRGHDWTVGEGAELGDIILAAVTLLDFEQGKQS